MHEVESRPSREPGRPSDFDQQWYSQAPVPSWPPPSMRPPPAPVGDPTSSIWLGAVSGGIGGVLMAIVAESILDFRHSGVDLVRALGRAASAAGVPSPGAQIGGVLCAAVLGAFLGAPLGFMARRLVRVPPRLVFFSLLLPVLWIFVQALVLGRVAAAWAARLPFGPLVIGAVVYGACLAVVPPSPARN
jgi:hypothetical protein